MYLPEWLLHRLRPIWSTFDEPPPNLTGKGTSGEQYQPKFTFRKARERLREAKKKANVDLDELFANLGLDTSKVALNAPIAWPVRAGNFGAAKDQTEKLKELKQKDHSPSPKQTRQHSHSPMKKRIRKVWDILDHGLTSMHAELKDSFTDKLKANAALVQPRQNATSHSSSYGDRERVELGPSTWDLLTLELYNNSPPRNELLTQCMKSPHIDRTISKLTNAPRVQGPGLFELERQTHLRRLQELNEESQEIQLNDQLLPPRRLNLSLQEIPSFESNFEESWMDAESQNLWITPIAPLRKTVRFTKQATENYPMDMRPFQSKTVSKDKTTIIRAKAPDHPMWDTPEDLKTSNFSIFMFPNE
ncbi:unnamed protein product [Echinostoma caproni]|uniref:Coiled-coil domain-containing protein 117 n=1 Tax=Echinostoma caproni TaxID=27848 RepID=A0A183AQU1_9TREM|nr:unnamed protein product [Echinostoma caproni]